MNRTTVRESPNGAAVRCPVRRVAIALNLLAAGWWIWAVLTAVLAVGPGVFASSGAILWAAFLAPPVASIVALTCARQGPP